MNAFVQCAAYLVVLIALAKPLGTYMANVYEGRYRFLAPLENLVYRVAGVKPEDDMDWKRYLWGVLWFNFIGFGAVYALQRLQEECARERHLALCRELETVMFADETASPYRAIGAKLGMSEGAVKTGAHRIRARLRDLICEEVRQTVASHEDWTGEIRYLIQLFER